MASPISRRRALRALTVLGCATTACAPRHLSTVRLERIWSVSDGRGGPGAMGMQATVSARQRSGVRIVITAGSIAQPPVVYNSLGHFIGTLAVAPGDRWEAPRFVRTGPGDSIWVFDGSRAVVFGADRQVARTVALPFSPWDAQVLADGRILLSPASADHPLPLELLDPQGQVVRTFALDSAGGVITSPRWILAASDGTFWTIPLQQRWRLEQWDSVGRLFRILDRNPAWYRELDSARGKEPPAPQPGVRGGWIDAFGWIWLVGSTPDVHWRSGLTAGGQAIADPDRVFDTVIEAVDPATGRVMVSDRFDASYAAAEPGILLHTHANPAGSVSAELFHVVTARQ